MNRRGFTLIELLVVIVIIGILMAILLPAIARALCYAKAAKAKTIIRQIETACETYEKEQNVYPDGNGTDSLNCSVRLKLPGPRGVPYVSASLAIDPTFGFMDPVVPTTPIHYRNNAVTPPPAGPPPVHNTNRVDLWCLGCNPTDPDPIGGPYELNNWK